MKDINDVVSYLNNVLGPCHDLTIVARQTAEHQSTVNYNHAEESILYALSGMIYMVTDGEVTWTEEELPRQVEHMIFFDGMLDEIVYELDLNEEYPEESDELMSLGIEIQEIIENQPERFKKLVKQIEKDHVSSILAELSS